MAAKVRSTASCKPRPASMQHPEPCLVTSPVRPRRMHRILYHEVLAVIYSLCMSMCYSKHNLHASLLVSRCMKRQKTAQLTRLGHEGLQLQQGLLQHVLYRALIYVSFALADRCVDGCRKVTLHMLHHSPDVSAASTLEAHPAHVY